MPSAAQRSGSTGNEDIVRSAYVCEFDRAQPDSLDATIVTLLSRLDPEIEFAPDTSDPTTNATRGQEQVRTLLEEAAQVWDAYRYDLSQLEEVGPGRVLVSGRICARRRGSSISVELPFANLWTLRHGRAIRIDAYPDRIEALEALRDRP